MKIFVAKLDYNTTEETLAKAFSMFGTVDTIKVVYDRETKKSKGFAFIEMSDDNAAKEAIAALDGVMMDGRNIVVKEAEDRPAGARKPFDKSRSFDRGDRPRSFDKPRSYDKPRDFDRNSGGQGGGKRFDNNKKFSKPYDKPDFRERKPRYDDDQY